MMLVSPGGIMLFPPAPRMPLMVIVPIAILLPVGVPVRMVFFRPIRIVVAPPICIPPLVLIVPVAPATTLIPLLLQVRPYIWMIAEVLVEQMMFFAESGIVKQGRICAQVRSDFRMVAQKGVELLVVQS